jgi:DNA-binding beta-propeller fold protein YncE
MKRCALTLLTIATLLLLVHTPILRAFPEGEALIPMLSATPSLTVSTVPPNGDVNPYGVAFVPRGFPKGGSLEPGDILVANFNDSANLQGTGTTIVKISGSSAASVFFQGSGLGLTTALGVLKAGFVLVGNVPTTDGSCATAGQGSLLVLDRNGAQVAELTDPALLDGPWDVTVRDDGARPQVFVSNVLNGTVTRLDLAVPVHGAPGKPTLLKATQIASGYVHRCDPAALVVGPTGVALDEDHDLLYVASTGDNAIYAIEHPGRRATMSGTGRLVYRDDTHLRGPLGLVLAPNGNLITTNGDAVNPDPTQPSELVEFTPGGVFVAERPVNGAAQGGAFGIAVRRVGDRIVFAAVDDVLNNLDVWFVE